MKWLQDAEAALLKSLPLKAAALPRMSLKEEKGKRPLAPASFAPGSASEEVTKRQAGWRPVGHDSERPITVDSDMHSRIKVGCFSGVTLSPNSQFCSNSIAQVIYFFPLYCALGTPCKLQS